MNITTVRRYDLHYTKAILDFQDEKKKKEEKEKEKNPSPSAPEWTSFVSSHKGWRVFKQRLSVGAGWLKGRRAC